MRISVDPKDEGYRYFATLQANGKRVSIFLDGAEVKHPVTADDEQGFVVRPVLDEGGNFQIDPVDQTLVWEERVTGVVQIKIEDAEKK